MWSTLFSLTNVIALIGWALLVAAPRKPLVHSVILYLCVALLCLIYTALFALVLAGAVDPHRVVAAGAGAGAIDFTTIAGVRDFFASDGGVVIGWTHYLAFDLFTGLWIARDGDNKGFSRITQAPFLLVTLLVGPVGLLAWLVMRERRARTTGRG